VNEVSRRDALRAATAGAAAAAGAVVVQATQAAEQKQEPKHNKEPAVESKASPDEHGPREMFAVVDLDGNLKRSLHAASSRRLDVGVFEVVFRRDVRRGVYQATIGGHGYSGVPPVGLVSVQGRADNPKAVLVSTSNTLGDPINLPFHLFVFCPEGYA
jgi:hypothetical protein